MIRLGHAVGGSVASALAFASVPASADEKSLEIVATKEGAASNPVIVRVGRALDFEGRPVWSGNTAFSQTARVATVLASPVTLRRNGARYTGMGGRPLLQGAVTSGFGVRKHPISGGSRMHSGIDLAAPEGSPILATSDGEVSMAGWGGGYGLMVRLSHGDGLETRYAHMSGLAVAAGQKVRKGEVLGFVGSTGRSTGSHLHYEVRVDGTPIRPSF